MEEITENKTSLKLQSAWLLFAKLISFALSVLLPLLVVRFLSQEQVGEYRQVFQVISNAVVILSLGFGMSSYYFLAREKEKHASVIFNILLFNFFMGGLAFLLLFFYPQIIGNIFQSDEITRLTPKIGVVIWIWIFSTFLEIVAVANQETRIATAFIISAQFSKTILMVSAVVLFSSVDAFIYAAMIQGTLQAIILLFYLNSRFPKFWTSFNPKFFREQLVYALPFGFAGLLWTLQTDIHNYFVGHRFSSSEYAVYAIGCFDLPLIAMIYESVSSVLIPRMSQLQAKDDKREMILLTAQTMQTLAFFYFPLCVFLFITANTFITTLFTHHYAQSVPIFLINLILIPFYIWITDPIVRAYKELGRMLLKMRIFVFIGMISALWFGIQHFDLRGMIAIVVVTAIIERIISTSFVMRKLEVNLQDIYLLKDVGKTALIALFAGLFTYFVYENVKEFTMNVGLGLTNFVFDNPKDSILDFVSGSLTLAVSLAVFLPIYLLTMNYFGVIADEEKQMFLKIFSKINIFSKKTQEPNSQSNTII